MRADIIDALGFIEYELDISETDTQKETIANTRKSIKTLLFETKELISTAKYARLKTVGASVVIYGKPNVGKSTLFNSLLNYERSIVTNIAGTTRDTVEEVSTVGNHSVVFIDTAGIRTTDDPIEKLGVNRTQEKINGADLSIQILTKLPKTGIIKNKNNLTVLNKIDLLKKTQLKKLKTNKNILCVSAKNKTGLPQLLKHINQKLDLKAQDKSENQITSIRQEQSLKKIQKNLKEALENKEGNLEIIAHHLGRAIKEFDNLLGKTSPDDILESVFSNFCVGK
jgi:tRNA modification GTPase